MAAMADKEALRLQWHRQFTKAQQHDSWGQVLEAQEEYQRIGSAIAAKQGLPSMTSKEKDIMYRLVLCLSARSASLHSMAESISSLDMKALEPVFETLFTGREPDSFPLAAHKYQSAKSVLPASNGEILCGDVEEAHADESDWQQARRVMREVKGTVVGLRIEKIGLKDAQDYIDPFMTVIFADPSGKPLLTHDTPLAVDRKPTCVTFNHQVYLKMSLEDMVAQKGSLFFEFKHYKPKKKKVSTRCWAFMELTELKPDEEIVLELYQKPTDLKKKAIKLHTEKPLYLHVHASYISS